MKRLLTTILFVVLALWVVDRIGGKIMWMVNQNTNTILGVKLKYLADEAHEDIIILGTSRSNFHYVSSIIEDSTCMSVYNGGIDGSDNIYSHYFVLNQIVRHHIPKIVCLEVMPSDYASDIHAFETTTFFAPYIGRSESADSIFIHSGNYWKYKLSHLYRYNAKAVADLGGLLLDKMKTNDKGYIPLAKPDVFPSIKSSHSCEPTDSLKLLYLQKFIDCCKQNGIQLLLTISPSYTLVFPELYKPLKDIANQNQIPFLDYHTQGVFHDDPQYFKDNRHLWDKGARIFTSMFVHDLKQVMAIKGCYCEH